MVSWVNLIDLLFVGLFVYGSKIAFERRYYIKFFEYFKLFIILYLASKLAPYSGTMLQKMMILKADTYITLILIAFGINFLILYNFWKYFIKVFNNYFSSANIRTLFAKVLSFLEVLIILSFGLYLMMQIYFIKINLQPTMKQTYVYPAVAKFYHKFLNNDIVKILEGSTTGTNSKEVLFKSFTNAI